MWEKILQKESYLSKRAEPQKPFIPHLNSKHSPIEPKKAQNNPQNKKIKKLENWKSLKWKLSVQWVNPKTLLRPHPHPKYSLIGPKKAPSFLKKQKTKVRKQKGQIDLYRKLD